MNLDSILFIPKESNSFGSSVFLSVGYFIFNLNRKIVNLTIDHGISNQSTKVIAQFTSRFFRCRPSTKTLHCQPMLTFR